MKKKHRTFRWMIGSLLVLSLAACQSDPETEETAEPSTTAPEISIAPVNLQDQATVDAANGIFEDSQVADRALSDWEGEWQSVYPYLLDGTLDNVFAEKAEETGEKTAEEYKEYYTVGYEVDLYRPYDRRRFDHVLRRRHLTHRHLRVQRLSDPDLRIRQKRRPLLVRTHG